MAIDWKTVLAVVAAALMSAGGTVGAQSIIGSPSQPQAFQLVKGMTGLCIRVEEPASPVAKAATVARDTK